MPDATEQQVEQIVVPLIVPTIESLLAKTALAASTALGISITYPSGTAETAAKIAGFLVTAGFVVWHEFRAWAQKKSAAKSAAIQGAATAGSTLLPHDIAVVSGASPAVTPKSP